VHVLLDRHRLQYELAGRWVAKPSSRRRHAEPGAGLRHNVECSGIGAAAQHHGGTSDGRFIARICPQVMEFGVINESIHKIDEWVDVAAVEPLKNVYLRTCPFLGQSRRSPRRCPERFEPGAPRS
jgi:succinyl-diaminopimelate desuccinylase